MRKPVSPAIIMAAITMAAITMAAILLALILAACSGALPAETSLPASPATLAYATQATEAPAASATPAAPAETNTAALSSTPASAEAPIGCTVVSPQPTPGPTLQSIFPPVSAQDWILGPETASVTLLEYSDFQ